MRGAAPEASGPIEDPTPSAALSQLGGTWPVDGRQIGVIVGDDVTHTAVTTIQRVARRPESSR